MHELKPNSKYAVVELHVAVPLPDNIDPELSEACATDGLNEWLNGQLIEHGAEAAVVDWAFGEVRIVETDEEVEEGILFKS